MSDTPLAQQTLKRATSALKSGHVSTMPEIVQLVQTLSRKSVEISVQELADLIKKDAGVLAKVLMAANAFGYNPNGVRVDSVIEAIHVVGFERIRTLAVSLILVEQTNRNGTAEERREAAAHALCSGFIAQSAAEAQGTVPGEQAYVCAALRHFGRIVMTSFMTEEYRKAIDLVDVLPEDEAFRQIFGLTPLELGHELLRAEQLPEEILAALRPCDPASISASAVTPAERLLALADFSTQLCDLIFAEGLPATEFAERSAALAGRFSHLLPEIATQIPAFITTVEVQFSRLKHGLGIRSLPLKCVERLKDRVARRDPRAARVTQTAPPFPLGKTAPPFPSATTAPFATIPPFAAPKPAAPKPSASGARLQSGLADIAALAAQTGTPADVLYRTVIDIIGEAFAAPEVFLFLRPDGHPALHLTHGAGQNWRNFQSLSTVVPGERTVFGLCLTRRENLLIHDAQDAAIAPYVPGWLRAAPGLQSYVLLPIVHAGQPTGLLLAGWGSKRKIVLPPEHVHLLRDLLAIVAERQARP